MQSVEVDDFCPGRDENGTNGFPHCRTCHLSFGAEDIMGRHAEANPEHRIGFMCSTHNRFEVLVEPRPWRTLNDGPAW